jgi:hypothetical protein
MWKHARVSGWRRWRAAAAVIVAATMLQLFIATFFAARFEQFEGKAFGARLVAYPAMMLLVPAIWACVRWRRQGAEPLPWLGFALIMLPFLIDVTGNTLDLYDTVGWWDDANHFANWLLLCAGIGVLLLRSSIRPPWALGLAVAGLGALLAIGWELGEWYTFIRHGTERDDAYTDTLGDLALGSLGGTLAAVVVARLAAVAGRVAPPAEIDDAKALPASGMPE